MEAHLRHEDGYLRNKTRVIYNVDGQINAATCVICGTFGKIPHTIGVFWERYRRIFL